MLTLLKGINSVAALTPMPRAQLHVSGPHTIFFSLFPSLRHYTVMDDTDAWVYPIWDDWLTACAYHEHQSLHLRDGTLITRKNTHPRQGGAVKSDLLRHSWAKWPGLQE